MDIRKAMFTGLTAVLVTASSTGAKAEFLSNRDYIARNLYETPNFEQKVEELGYEVEVNSIFIQIEKPGSKSFCKYIWVPRKDKTNGYTVRLQTELLEFGTPNKLDEWEGFCREQEYNIRSKVDPNF